MGLESATYISDLVTTNPDGDADPKSQGDDHIKLLKSALQNTFSATFTAAVTADNDELNSLAGRQAFIDTFLQAGTEALARAALNLGTASIVDTGTADDEVPTGAELKGTVRAFTKQQRAAYDGALTSTSGTVSWDTDDAQVAILSLTENVTTFGISSQVAGATYILLVKNGDTYTITWPASVLWPYGGTAPTLVGTDLVTMVSDGTNLHAVHIPNFS